MLCVHSKFSPVRALTQCSVHTAALSLSKYRCVYFSLCAALQRSDRQLPELNSQHWSYTGLDRTTGSGCSIRSSQDPSLYIKVESLWAANNTSELLCAMCWFILREMLWWLIMWRLIENAFPKNEMSLRDVPAGSIWIIWHRSLTPCF